MTIDWNYLIFVMLESSKKGDSYCTKLMSGHADQEKMHALCAVYLFNCSGNMLCIVYIGNKLESCSWFAGGYVATRV